ncbi:MAG: MCE family protein [Planctomycetes bacterium]|nr:MCE family protein [Planctomycetota bacterium]
MPVAPTNHWKLGLFVVIGFGTLLVVAVWLGARRFERQTFIAYSYFDEPVTGLEIGSPVRFRGMTIGTIEDIRAAPDRHHLEVQSAIDVQKLEQIGLREPGEIEREGVVIPFGLRARIERSFVTGVAFVQTDFFDPARYPLPRYPFDVPAHTVHSVPSSQKTFERGLEDLLVYVPELVQSLRNLTTELHGVIDNADVAGTTRSMREALEELRKAIAAIDWDGIEERARSTLDSASATGAELRAMVAELRAPDGGLQRALGGATSLVEELRSSLRSADLPAVAKSLRRLTDELAPLGDEATESLATLRRAADAIRELAALLERDPGALLRGRDVAPDPRTRR